MKASSCVLTVNGGSSSVRFAVFETGGALRRRLTGKVDRIGLSGTTLTATRLDEGTSVTHRIRGTGYRVAADFLLDWLEAEGVFADVRAVGHRVVHGMTLTEPVRLTPRLVAQFRRIIPYDPEHLPQEIALIEAIGRRWRGLPQVACFDTAFHRGMPRVAKLLPIPRRFAGHGIERYGFHGLSYTYLMERLRKLDPAAAKERVILAHLGNGASLAAVRAGRSIDTSMGFTPASGLVMSARSGDLDPGLVYYLQQKERMTPARFRQMVNHESGMLGVSGTSPDIRDLLKKAPRDPRAADAIALFCYQAKKWIGAYAAALGGLDTLVFAGGIGENAAAIRAQICADLDFLGLRLDSKRNARNSSVISTGRSRVKVRIIPTDEELMIAHLVTRVVSPKQS